MGELIKHCEAVVRRRIIQHNYLKDWARLSLDASQSLPKISGIVVIGNDDRDFRTFDAQKIAQIKYIFAEGKILVNVGLSSCAYALRQLWRIEETADCRGQSYGIETGHHFTADFFNQL